MSMKLRVTTECSEVVDQMVRKCASAVLSEMASTQCSKTAHGICSMLHREMTVRLEQVRQHPLLDGDGADVACTEKITPQGIPAGSCD